MTRAKERRPDPGQGSGGGCSELTTGEYVPFIFAQDADNGTHLDPQAAADAVRDALVVVVRVNGHDRRRVYLTLGSATAAAERARERGQDASVVLCRLQPVVGGAL
jgi:hypothetical protein